MNIFLKCTRGSDEKFAGYIFSLVVELKLFVFYKSHVSWKHLIISKSICQLIQCLQAVQNLCVMHVLKNEHNHELIVKIISSANGSSQKMVNRRCCTFKNCGL